MIILIFCRFHLDCLLHFYSTELYLLLGYFSYTQMSQKLEKEKICQFLLMMTRKMLGFWNKNH